MHTSPRFVHVARLPLLCGLIALVFVLAACQPIQDPRLLEQGATGAETPAAGTIPGVEPAKATITAESLRVRSAPSDNAEVVTGAREGETYPVLAISSDGGWLQLEIERAPEGTGWVAASFVTLEGDITNIPTVELEDVLAEAGVAPSAEATPAAAEAPAAEATPAATPEPTEEAAEEVTATEEITGTEEVTGTAAATETEEVAETEEMTATGEVTATEEMTATEGVTTTGETTATAETEAPALGYVTINSGDTPLRVRSAPTTEEDNKVGNVYDGEIYRVLEVSEDGQWVRIDIPELNLENGGWVSAEFVIMGQ